VQHMGELAAEDNDLVVLLDDDLLQELEFRSGLCPSLWEQISTSQCHCLGRFPPTSHTISSSFGLGDRVVQGALALCRP